jgi:hypothetical protein
MKTSKLELAISDVIAEQPPLNATVLWKFARDDFSEWIRLGMGEADSYGEYLRRLKEAERVAEEQGVAVLYCRKSPIEVAAWMLSEDLDPTNPEHRAVAIGVLSHDD